MVTIAMALVTSILAVLSAPGVARAESCSYDSQSKTLTAAITAGATATLIIVDGELRFGTVPAACGGATSTNTDTVVVSGVAGSNETLVVDQRTTVLGPGATSEFNTPEIELTANMGDVTDKIVVYGTEGDDLIAPGQTGMALNSDGDVDIVFTPNNLRLEIHGLGGNDYLNARGQGGGGLKYLGPVSIFGGEGDDPMVRGGAGADYLDGGPGNDNVEGGEGEDSVLGGPGNDTMSGGDQNDLLVGGPGVDSFAGSGGDDIMRADDGEADSLLNGGSEQDTAYVDTGLDPKPRATETVIESGSPPPPPPPPPPGACTYSAGSKAASVTLAAGAQGTLVVGAGGAILFGSPAVACGAATTANTDSIAINGQVGSVETVTVDGSAGALAPGATAESTGTSEIEIALNLGDASDVVRIKGTTGADTMAVGTNGVALNGDDDVDVTFTVLPTSIEFWGLAGPNVITARGGFGAGGAYTGAFTARAGDSGDTLTGSTGNDQLFGGAGNDTLSANNGNDTLDGAGGNDTLTGGGDDDVLTGGSGADALIGSSGNDTLYANDGQADTQINGGSGIDTAYYDLGLDPNPFAETKIGS